MSAKGLFAETLSGVAPDPNAPAQPKNTHFVEPVSSMVSTWRGSGEHVVIAVEPSELSSLVSTQRGSGVYASVTTVDYHTSITGGQTLPFGTRIDESLVLAKAVNSVPAPTPRLTNLVVDNTPTVATAQPNTPPTAVSSLLPNALSLPVTPKTRSRRGPWVAALAALGVLCGVLAVPLSSQTEATLVPALAVRPQPTHARNAGLVGKVHVNVGDVVESGQTLVSLDANDRARDAERLRLRIAQLTNELEQLVSKDRRLHSAALGALQKKRAVLLDRLAHQGVADHPQSVGRPSNRHQVPPEHSPEELNMPTSSADTTLNLQQQLADVDFLRYDRTRSFEQRQRSTEAALAEAHAERLHVNSIELTTRAATKARVTRVLVQPGQAVVAGAALLELAPLDAPTKLVGYVAEEALSSIDPTADVRVDLSALFTSDEQTTYDSRLTFVANAPSAADEVQSILGFTPNQPVRRVEVEWPEALRTRDVQAQSTAYGALPRIAATFTAHKEPLANQLLRSWRRVWQTR